MDNIWSAAHLRERDKYRCWSSSVLGLWVTGRDTIKFTPSVFSLIRKIVKLCFVTSILQFCVVNGKKQSECTMLCPPPFFSFYPGVNGK